MFYSKRLLAFLGIVFALPVLAEDIIICGSGGEPHYENRFADWGKRLQTVLVDVLGRTEQEVHLLTGSDEQARSDLANLRNLFSQLAKTHKKEEDLFVYLIGHGSYLRQVSKLQVPGEDLNANELADMLASIPARRTVVVNSASASAGFINVLSKSNRIICSATKSAYEGNATEFMEFFIQGLEEGLADSNRDGRISVWEAAQLAAALTEAHYLEAGLIATEHAVLDDNGDGLGTRLYLRPEMEPETKAPETPDGKLARSAFLKDFTFPKDAPQKLVADYLSVMTQVEALSAKKTAMEKGDYYGQLEQLFLKAARLHREIRSYQ